MTVPSVVMEVEMKRMNLNIMKQLESSKGGLSMKREDKTGEDFQATNDVTCDRKARTLSNHPKKGALSQDTLIH